MTLRRAAVAGTWYPGTPERLAAEVSAYLNRASEESRDRASNAAVDDADVVALVAPHAGLMYSGPVAAHAYRLLRRREYDTIVLVGPSHYVPFEGASIWPRGAFETPSGPLQIDADTAGAIATASGIVVELPAAHAREHSLELQLPFLATLAAAVPIVPIVMGLQTRDTAFALGDALASTLAGRRALLVASSDLSHFYDARTAQALDQQVITEVERLDAVGLMDLLERKPDHACGGGPIVSVLHAARALGATQARVLKYADSGDVSGDKSSVVGYMAAAIWR
jgi:MEMO1 family protein